MWYDLRKTISKEEIIPGPEYKDTPEVTAEPVLDLTVKTLQEHLNLSIEGSKCHTIDVLRLLVAASAEGSSIESACRETETSPSGLFHKFLGYKPWPGVGARHSDPGLAPGRLSVRYRSLAWQTRCRECLAPAGWYLTIP